MPSIRLEWSDDWLDEVRGLIESQRRPDNLAAFAARLSIRIGGERSYEETVAYLSNCLYNAIRYADAVTRDNYGEAVPTVHNATEPVDAIPREVILDDEDRITALNEIGTLGSPLERRAVAIRIG